MIKQLIKGVATFVPGVYRVFGRKGTGGTGSGRYCYCVWLRHMVMAHQRGLCTDPHTIAELGPGDSIGIGLAGLISGAERYYAFDVVAFASVEHNIEVFDELVRLFKDREHIPGQDEFPRVQPRLESYAFPHDLFTDGRLSAAMDADRLASIRQSILDVNSSGSIIQYKVPWHDADIVESESVDMVFSQAVLEHVDEPALAYQKMYQWLKPGGFMSHSIDFSCHATADEWNGHWAYSDFLWTLIRGKRPYLINRLPHSEHIRQMEATGFKVVADVKTRIPSRVTRKKLARRFRDMEEDDLVTRGTFVQARK